MVNQDDIIQEEILRAAIGLYRKLGPNKVTMDDVANATGRSRTSLYYYYKNRDDIFHAVLDTISNDVAADIRAKIATAETLSDKIYAFCLAKLKKSDDWKAMFSAMWASTDTEEKNKHTSAMEVLHKKLMYQERIILNEIISATANQANIRTLSPTEQDMLTFIISSGIRGIRSEIYNQNDPHDIKAAMRLLTDMIVKWLTK